MAGARANLAVTKDGEAYNKLQRPDFFVENFAALNKTNERKRERAAFDRSVACPTPGNKRAKTHHTESMANKLQSRHDKYQHHSAGPVSECGMRMTLPIDEEEYSDDSMGEALAYLRSVRSEASTIPHLIVASKPNNKDTHNVAFEGFTAATSPHVIYQDGAWISIDKGHETTCHEDQEFHDPSPEELYYKQLIRRFETLRDTLYKSGVHRLAQESVAEANRLPIVKPPSNRHEWLYTLDREYPTLAQISRLDEKSIRRGLEYCIYAMDRFDSISGQKSCWIWTLLALSSEVGTLDSQKMSHIRDLGTKASQLSINLHIGIKSQDVENEDSLPLANPAADDLDEDTEANRTVPCNTSGDDYSSGMGNVRLGAKENVSLEIQNGEPPPATTLETSDISAGAEENTDTNTNNCALERARARLLAQLGDNLVQAGIPSSPHNLDGTRHDRNEQLDQSLNDPQHETKARPILSRAEAERQRQMMRVQNSAKEISREADFRHSESPATMHHIAEEHSSHPVDLNTRVTIDMILTVVAECYGQRDLLSYRKPW
ncbi:hypothetical protein M3J09_003328 [Ascochyta lentis]